MAPSLIRGLIVFCAAARYLSFKMAADELCITPSAVSHQIKALEARVGCPLFERQTRAIVLTPTGALLFTQLDQLLRRLDSVVKPFLNATGSQRAALRVALHPFFASERFIPALGEFARDHPWIDMRIDTIEGAEIPVPPGCDASIVLLDEGPAGFHWKALFELHLVPACAPAIVPESDLTSSTPWEESVLIVHKSRPDAWKDWFDLTNVSMRTQPKLMYLDSMFSVARAAEKGLGIALVPTPLIDAWFDSGSLVRLSDQSVTTGEHYYFVRSADDAPRPELLALEQWVQATFA